MIFVGVDLGKREHAVCFLDADGREVARPLRVPHTGAGVRRLQDELARREQHEPPPQQQSGGNSGSWRVDRSGRHGKPANQGPFEHPNQTTGPMIINGVPPHERGYPPAN